MALNIKNAETERLARELARRRRQGITEVVTETLRRELERERRRPRRDSREAFLVALRELGERASRYPEIHRFGDDDILGYDDTSRRPAGGGLP